MPNQTQDVAEIELYKLDSSSSDADDDHISEDIDTEHSSSDDVPPDSTTPMVATPVLTSPPADHSPDQLETPFPESPKVNMQVVNLGFLFGMSSMLGVYSAVRKRLPLTEFRVSIEIVNHIIAFYKLVSAKPDDAEEFAKRLVLRFEDLSNDEEKFAEDREIFLAGVRNIFLHLQANETKLDKLLEKWGKYVQTNTSLYLTKTIDDILSSEKSKQDLRDFFQICIYCLPFLQKLLPVDEIFIDCKKYIEFGDTIDSSCINILKLGLGMHVNGPKSTRIVSRYFAEQDVAIFDLRALPASEMAILHAGVEHAISDNYITIVQLRNVEFTAQHSYIVEKLLDSMSDKNFCNITVAFMGNDCNEEQEYFLTRIHNCTRAANARELLIGNQYLLAFPALEEVDRRYTEQQELQLALRSLPKPPNIIESIKDNLRVAFWACSPNELPAFKCYQVANHSALKAALTDSKTKDEEQARAEANKFAIVPYKQKL